MEELANKMEHAEKRKEHPRLARTKLFFGTCPVAIPEEINREICEAFVNLIVKKYNVAAHVPIHKPDESRIDETHREK